MRDDLASRLHAQADRLGARTYSEKCNVRQRRKHYASLLTVGLYLLVVFPYLSWVAREFLSSGRIMLIGSLPSGALHALLVVGVVVAAGSGVLTVVELLMMHLFPRTSVIAPDGITIYSRSGRAHPLGWSDVVDITDDFQVVYARVPNRGGGLRRVELPGVLVADLAWA